jgi:hypothetical protein
MMLRFQRPPDVVFQAILRDSLDLSIDFIDILIENNDYDEARVRECMEADYPAMAKVFTPLLARTTLWNLRKRLDRPEIYSLNNYHYLLLFDVMSYFADIHNGMVAMSESGEERVVASFVDPFYIESIDVVGLLDLYFFDTDFLTDAETMLNIPDWVRRSYEPETFGLSLGMLPHAEELELKIDACEDDGAYKATRSDCFGPKSTVYPDFDYYYDKHRTD